MSDAETRLAAALAGRYAIERELGAGGMATVYLARDLKHDRRVALKVLRPELAAALGPERFLREIRTTASLAHPHIVPLYDSGEAGDALYYVMPFVEGESLRARLAREGPLPVGEALQIARDVADALGYAHGRGVIHRDIKPENILLEGGHAVVADFGIARAIAAVGAGRLTATGLVLGTPVYMSPEQAAGESHLDGRSDLYALGCVLYEMLAGQPPFTGPTAESVVHQHLAGTPAPITQLRPAVSLAVSAAVQRALAKTPADRFGTALQFAETLQPVAAGTTGRRRRRPAALGAATLAAAGLLALAYYLIAPRTPSPVHLGRRLQVTIEPGLELDPALSPDGKFAAYSGPGGVLFVRQVEGAEPIRVVRDGDGRGRWPAWVPPDGQRLVFVAPRGVEVVPALGGAPRVLVATAAARGVTVSPDGRSLAFTSRDSLYAIPLDGGTPHLITTGWEMHSPAWSPDGRWIAFVSGNWQYISQSDLGNIAPSSIWIVRATGGRAIRISDDRSANVSPAWASAEALLYLSDREGSRDVYQVGVSRSGRAVGAPARVTTGLNAHGIAVSLNGARLAYSAYTETSNVWSLPVPAHRTLSVSQAQPVTVGNQTIENIGVSDDDRWIAFNSDRTGTTQLYRKPLRGGSGEAQQLTYDTLAAFWSSWSPDGREIAFHKFRGERRQVFVISVDGGGPVPVTDGSVDERSPEWSPDGRSLLLLASWGTHPALHVVTRGAAGRWSAARPLPVVIGADTVVPGIAAWSPDGRSIACGCGIGGLVVVPMQGGAPHRLVSPYSTAGWAFPQWSDDGRTLFHLMEDSGHVAAVVAVPLGGGAPWVAVRFDDATRPWHRFGFRVRAGRFYFTLGDRQSHVWMAELARR